MNKVMLIGNLGRDPDVRATANGTQVANLSVATTSMWRRGEERGERTEWHRVVLFGRMAEVAQRHLKKGDTVYIEGRLQTRKWQDDKGEERFITEVVGNEMLMLGRPGKKGAEVEREVQDAPQARPAKPAGDDDIPF